MASPFKVFRKRQKMMIAVLGLLAMIAFVVLPILMQSMGSRQVSNPSVVTTAKYGDIHEYRLHNMLQDRQMVLNFLQRMRQAVSSPEDPSLEYPVIMAMQEIGKADEEAVVDTWLLARRAEELGLVVGVPAINEYLAELIPKTAPTKKHVESVLTYLLRDDEKAIQKSLKSFGFPEGDDAVASGGPARAWELLIQEILKSLGISESNLFGLLQRELLAVRLRNMFEVSLRAVPPAQRWDYYQRMTRQVSIQAVPIPVARYVTKVANPDDPTLRAFFDQYKDKLPSPDSPDPGFREPHRIAVEYFKAKYEKFIDLAAVTEEEIEEEYEKSKDLLYQRETLPGDDEGLPAAEPAGQEPAGEEPGAAEAPGEEPGAAEAPGEEPGAAEAPGDTVEPREPEQPPQPEETPAPDQPSTGPAEQPAQGPQDPAGTDSSPAPAAEEAVPGSTESDQSSSGRAITPFLLASYLQEGDPSEEPASETPEPAAEPAPAETTPAEPPATEAPPAETPAAEAPPAETPATEAPPAEPPAAEAPPTEPPAAEAPPTETPAAEAPPGETPAAEAPPAQPPAAGAPAGESPSVQPPAAEAPPAETPSAEPPPAEGPALGTTPAEEPGETLEGVVDSVLGKYIPLEKVKDEIRRRLARQKTATKIRSVFDPLRNRVMDYRNELIRYRVDSEGKSGDEAPPPPAKPDLQALAKSSGLTVHRAKLLSALDVAEEDVGRSSIVVPDAEGTPQQIPFRRYAYAGLPEYRPEISQDVEGDHYLFWIVEDSEERVPKFEEKGVRDGVLRAWKMVRARSLAEQEGQRLAAEAGKAKKSLKEAFAGKPGIVVNESEPFTWLTYGSVSALFARNYPRISPIKKRTTDPQGAGQGERDAVVMPGNEFMRAVYNLKRGEIGLAMNHPKTAVYVVQLMETNPLPDVLWGRFLAESYYPYYLVDVYDRTQSQEAWLESIKSDAGLKWERDPREYRSR